jgi:simple sugar transport system ATP-binding protein
MRGIVKRFAETQALAGVDFELRPGEIHALLGENGAGKSTLMQVLSGLYQPNAGEIEVRGKPVRFRSARDAAACRIGMVHQHFTLVDSFTVAENLALALPARTPFLLPRRNLAADALAIAERLGWKLDPNALVWQLPVGVQQRLEIVKVLAQEPEILIFDEPTAVLAPVELDELFDVLKRLRDEGKSLVFISHKLNEVMRLCDRVTVLRRGHHAGTVAIEATDPADLARRMVGGEEKLAESLPGPVATPVLASVPVPTGPPVLHVADLRVRDERGVDAVRGLSLDVRAGEILGIAGVDGNGQAELAEALLGLRHVEAGTMEISGRDAAAPGQRGRLGYVPQDRKRSGLVPGMSVRDNLILELHQEPRANAGPWLRWGLLNAEAREMMARYDVRASGLDQPADTLSGGNQQKIVIGRALHKKPDLLVALNPTRGVDVGATAYVHDQLRAQRERGAAILLISTELDEVLALSDRVGVLYEGRLMGVVSPTTSRETLGLMMGGSTGDHGAAAP